MTAEIAILNKSAIALAADSAVSIGQSPNLKIYNTVNKIFELSCDHPIGIMIYGRLDFMGLPLETVIKEYRRSVGEDACDKVEGYRDKFITYLSKQVPFDNQDEKDNIYLLVFDLLAKAEQEIQELVLQDVVKRGSYQKSKTNGISQAYINEKIVVLKQESFAEGFSQARILPKYNDVIDQLLSAKLANIFPTEKTKQLFRVYIRLSLTKNIFSSYRTGIVFARFGSSEICPSLEAIEIDGIVNGKLKFSRTSSIDIGRRPPQADILGFAQDDMMKSFLDGADPGVRNYFNGLVGDIIKDTSRLILGSTLANTNDVDKYLAAMDHVIKKMQTDYIGKIDKFIEKYSSNPIKEMIRLMPRQEMATLASSLIEITSLKRKVTRQQETVGGEVDVAIISKSEGFVWVKRKHYFPPELNQRFFSRHYRTK